MAVRICSLALGSDTGNRKDDGDFFVTSNILSGRSIFLRLQLI